MQVWFAARIKTPHPRLTHFAGSRNRAAAYHAFEIPKRRGGTRRIHAPTQDLLWIQRGLLQLFTHLFPRHKACHGFERGKSIVTHARQHVRKRWVYGLDLKDFFPSCTWPRVYGMLQGKPFHCAPDVARLIANLVTHEGALPQGAPTSPVLANLLAYRLDVRLSKWARDNGYVYSRYADDLAFSTQKIEVSDADRAAIAEIVASEGFTVNDEKTRCVPHTASQFVTGLVVNRKVNVPRPYIRHLRALLFNLKIHGWESQATRSRQSRESADALEKKSLTERRAIRAKEKAAQRAEHLLVRPRLVSHLPHALHDKDPKRRRKKASGSALYHGLRGQIAFVAQVRGEDDGLVRHLRERFARVEQVYKGIQQIKAAPTSPGFVPTLSPEGILTPSQASQDLRVAVNAYQKALQKDPAADSIGFKQTLFGLSEHFVELHKLLAVHADKPEKLLQEVELLEHRARVQPATVATLLRTLSNRDSFGGLLHDPNSETLPLESLLANARAELHDKWLPWHLRELFEAVLDACTEFAARHPDGMHPWNDDPSRGNILVPFKRATRFDNAGPSAIMARLEKHRLIIEAAAAERQERPVAVQLVKSRVGFLTDTDRVIEALKALLSSMTEHTRSDAVSVEASRIKNDEPGALGEVVVRVFDEGGALRCAPLLHEILKGGSNEALRLLRGLCQWTLTARFEDGMSFHFDVFRNTAEPLRHDAPGIEHRFIFLQ